jgi:hypothetical protein
MSGGETNVLTWYITNYASKKQQRSSNVSALLAKRLAFHSIEERGRTDLSDINKRLIQRCANTLTRDREFSGPEIMSYLMGWGDRFESHHYVGISADGIMRALKQNYPALNSHTVRHMPDSESNAHLREANSTDDRSHTITMVSGEITLKDQLHDYMFRGEELGAMSLFSFMLDTYDAKAEPVDDVTDDPRGDIDGRQSTRGRPPNRRIPYRQGFTRTGRCRVMRTAGHETLPHFMGGWFPRNDRLGERELYCASILALLKPWTNLSELKTDAEAFEEAFETFVAASPKGTQDIIENIQYYYECYDGAKKRQEARASGLEAGESVVEYEGDEARDDLMVDSIAHQAQELEVTDEDIELAYLTRGPMRERLHAEVALNTAVDYGVFSGIVPQSTFLPLAGKAHPRDLETFRAWEEQLKTACRKEAEEGGPAILQTGDSTGETSQNETECPGTEPRPGDDNVQRAAAHRPKRDLLKGDQRRAHDIIERQLLKRIAGKF